MKNPVGEVVAGRIYFNRSYVIGSGIVAGMVLTLMIVNDAQWVFPIVLLGMGAYCIGILSTVQRVRLTITEDGILEKAPKNAYRTIRFDDIAEIQLDDWRSGRRFIPGLLRINFTMSDGSPAFRYQSVLKDRTFFRFVRTLAGILQDEEALKLLKAIDAQQWPRPDGDVEAT